MTTAIEERRSWAYARLRLASEPAPQYGSDDWLELEEHDARKLAGLIVAAEAWARGADNLEENLRQEVEAARLAHKHAEDAEYVAQARAHRERWKGGSNVLPFAKRRQRQFDAAEPRLGDYAGGVVEQWDGGDAS